MHTATDGRSKPAALSMLASERPRNVGRKQAAGLLFGDWGTSRLYVLGLAFLFCKGLEYRDDLTKNLFPGADFPLKPPQTELFWMLYWIMTGIHAVHLSAGIAVVITVTVLFSRRIVPVQDSTMEGVATYWHFVDSVWLVLYPLLYLVGRS